MSRRRNLIQMAMMQAEIVYDNSRVYVIPDGAWLPIWIQNGIHKCVSDIQEAIDSVDKNGEVWISQGSYIPVSATGYMMKKGITLCGGFNGTELISKDQSNSALYPVIFEGDPIGNGLYTDYKTRSCRVQGTGTYLFKNITIQNFGNSANNGGVAFFIDADFVNDIYWVNVNLKNILGFNGAAIYNSCTIDSTANKRDFRNCTFDSLTGNGGSLYYFRLVNPNFYSCTFKNCHADNGGIAYSYQCTSSFYNCLIFDNTSDFGGAIGYSYTSNAVMKFYNCSMSNNTSASGGNGFDCDASSIVVHLYNSILDNEGLADGGAMALTAQNSNVKLADIDTDLGGNIESDPLFTDAANDDYILQATSPCLDAGDNSLISETLDLSGNPRISNTTVDMGCYEFQVSGTNTLTENGVELTENGVTLTEN